MARPKKVIKPKTKKKECKQCKREIALDNFYKNKNELISSDGYTPLCKECIKESINYDDMNTVYKILQTLDLPFFFNYWEIAKNKVSSDPFGKYIQMANSGLNEFLNANYSNSYFQSKESIKQEKKESKNTKSEGNKKNKNTKSRYDSFEVNDDICDRWGWDYTQKEYFYFEKKYEMLKNNYPEKTSMHTEALLKYIRFSVKEELATADGNVGEAKSWGGLAKDAAIQAKITPSQLSKVDLQDGLNSFGEARRALEQADDILSILPKFKERPQDKCDIVLWLYINYCRDLTGLPECSYKDIYKFYQDRIDEYSAKKTEQEDGEFDV